MYIQYRLLWLSIKSEMFDKLQTFLNSMIYLLLTFDSCFFSCSNLSEEMRGKHARD